jgi:hypothetical protein
VCGGGLGFVDETLIGFGGPDEIRGEELQGYSAIDSGTSCGADSSLSKLIVLKMPLNAAQDAPFG